MKIKIYKTIILPVVLYGCETWSVTLREETRIREFENEILRRIFGPKRNKMGSGENCKMENEILRKFPKKIFKNGDIRIKYYQIRLRYSQFVPFT